jgi:hypothetical protein
MQFLTKEETNALEKKLRRQIAEHSCPKHVIYYDSGDRNYFPAAEAIAQSLGKFSEATVLFLFSLSGDGWGYVTPGYNQRNWNRYRKWRASHGEDRRLYDAPGHRFEAHEAGELSKLIEIALLLGWDALLSVKPKRQLLLLSHDDRLEIYRSHGGRALVKQLSALGYWHD